MENQEKPVRIARISTEIRTGHFSDKSGMCYCLNQPVVQLRVPPSSTSLVTVRHAVRSVRFRIARDAVQADSCLTI